jgi:hypothetical protein
MHMRPWISAILGVAMAANGIYMLWGPESWYGMVPGVPDTGPLNPHFVRDIGCAYFVAGGALIGFALDHRFRAAALAGAAFLTLHAFVHLWDAAAGHESIDHLAGDLPAIFVPGVLALWLAWPRGGFHEEKHDAEMADSAAHRRL